MQAIKRTLFPTTRRDVIKLIDYCYKRDEFIKEFGIIPEQYFANIAKAGFSEEAYWSGCLDVIHVLMKDWWRLLDDDSDIKSDRVSNWVV